MPNIRLKRYTGAAWENLDVQTEWAQILNKPTTFTPTAHTHVKADITDFGHTHGNISNTGTITSTTVTPADQDRILIADNSASGSIERGIIIGTATTTFLRNDGTWATPAGSGVSGSGIANEITYWTATSTLGSLATATYPSLTELARVKGLTSAVQTQLDGKAPTSHATSATTYGVGTNANYGHVRGATRLTGASDGESGVAIVSGIAYATKTLRVNAVAQQSWGTLLDLDTTEGSILRFVDLTLTRTEGGITYYVGSIMVDINVVPTNNFTTTPTPTVTGGYRWRLPSQNSANTQVTLPIYMYRNTVDNALRAYVDQATAATYDYECVGYF
jgi:hypothetical protein